MKTVKAPATIRNPVHWAALLAVSLCSPAFAASTVEIACDDEHDPISEVAVSEITADPAAHNEDLAPRVEALIREAFSDDTATRSAEDADDTVEEIAIRDAVDRSLPVTLPGVTSDEVELYKRRMYRTDI